MNFDGDMHCSDCDWIDGGGIYDLKEANKNHMIWDHSLLSIIKITMLLCDFMADHTC